MRIPEAVVRSKQTTLAGPKERRLDGRLRDEGGPFSRWHLHFRDVIAARPENVPVPGWHRAIFAERLAEYERDPNEGVSWEELRAELQAEAKKR